MLSKKLILAFLLFGVFQVSLLLLASEVSKEQPCLKDFIFKTTITGCLIGTLIPPISVFIRNMQERWCVAKTKSLGPISIAFIQYTLKLHGYSDHELKDVLFRQSDRFECFDRVISVQFNDHELCAVILHLSPSDRKYLAAQLVRHGLKPMTISSRNILKLPIPNTLFLELYKNQSTKESPQIFFKKMILEWQASLLHEMSHARHRDTQLKRATVLFSYLLLLWNIDYIAPTMKKKLMMLPIAFVTFYKLLPLGLGKYCEWRADQEIIQRAHDPLMLQTEAEFYNALNALQYKNRQFDRSNGTLWEKLHAKIMLAFPWLDEILDEHPRHSWRAQYFKKAFEERIELMSKQMCS